MRKLLFILLCISFLAIKTFSQQVIRLYDGKTPGSEEWNYKEIEWSSSMMSGRMIRNVVDPTLEVYMPEKSIATGTAVIIAPGGGNIWLSYSNEGTNVAKWLSGSLQSLESSRKISRDSHILKRRSRIRDVAQGNACRQLDRKVL